MPYPEGDTITCRNCGAEMTISTSAEEEKYICPSCDAVILVWIRTGENGPDPRHLC